jgi:hypothetical protein
LGALIEKLTGEQYNDFIQTSIFNPLGMSDSQVFAGTTTMVPNQADGYQPYSSSTGWTQADYLPGEAAFSSGGIVSSAVDMGKYITAMLNGMILDPSSYYSLWASTPIPRYPFNPTQPEYGLRGMGWDIDNWTNDGPVEVRKDGGMPGYSTELILYPIAHGNSGTQPYAHGDGVFVSINTSTDSSPTPADVRAVDVANAVYEAALTAAITGTVSSAAAGSGPGTASGPLAGWTVYIDVHGAGHYVAGDPTQITDANGYYVFNNVAPGRHTIGLVPQAGWRPVQPSSWTVSLSTAAGAVSNQDFTLSMSTDVVGTPRIRASRHQIRITFDNDLNAIDASNVNDYMISRVGSITTTRTRHHHRLQVQRAVYDPATQTVTLMLSHRLPKHRPVQLRITGDALKSVLGVPLSVNGVPGAAYIITL